MAENFYTILTSVGKSKLANSTVLGSKVNLKTLQVGDGNGTYHEPSEDQTSLINKVWVGEISSISTDESNSNWIIIQTIIPATDGGFYIREAGIFDEEGDLIAVSKVSETYKPVISEGSAKDVAISIVLEVSNVDNITLNIDPNIVVATKNDIKVLGLEIENFNTRLSEKANITSPTFSGIVKTAKNVLDDGYGKVTISGLLTANSGMRIPTSTIVSATTLTSAVFGTVVWLGTTNSATYTVTLPNAGGLSGASISFWNNSGVNQTLAASGCYFYGNGANANSFTLPSDATITVVSDGYNWIVMSGGYLFNGRVVKALGGTGFKIQSGLASGVISTANNAVNISVTFPTAFSSNPQVYSVMNTSSGGGGGYYTVMAQSVSTTGFNIYFNCYTPCTGYIYWLAIGN